MQSNALRAKDAPCKGTSRTALWRAWNRGDLDRIFRGIYRRSDAPAADWEWIEAALRRPEATICLTSALAYHGLTDDIPDALDIAIPRGSWVPQTNEGAIRWHTFAAETFEHGRELIAIPGTDELKIGIYSPERCIVDAFRLRGGIGYETGRDALQAWLKRGGKPSALLELATWIPRARTPLLQALTTLA